MWSEKLLVELYSTAPHSKMRPTQTINFLKGAGHLSRPVLSSNEVKLLGDLVGVSHRDDYDPDNRGAFGRVQIMQASKGAVKSLSLLSRRVAVKIQRLDRYEDDVMMDILTFTVRKRILAKPMLSSKMWMHEMFIGSLLAGIKETDIFVAPLLYFEDGSFDEMSGSYVKTANMIMPAYEPLGGSKGAFKRVIKHAKDLYSLVLQILTGLWVAQREVAFVHRDLHMGNIFAEQTEAPVKITLALPSGTISLSSTFVPKVGDFGLSRAETDKYVINSFFDTGIARGGVFSHGADVAMLLGPSLVTSLSTTDVEASSYYYLVRLFLGIDTTGWPDGPLYDVYEDVIELISPHYVATRPKESFSACVFPIDEVRLLQLANHAGFPYTLHKPASLPKMPRFGKLQRFSPGPTEGHKSTLLWLEVSTPSLGTHIARVDMRLARRAGFTLVSASSKLDPGDFVKEHPGLAFNGSYFSADYVFALLGYTTPEDLPRPLPALYRSFYGTVVVGHSLQVEKELNVEDDRLAGVMEVQSSIGKPSVVQDLAIERVPAGPILVKDGEIVFSENEVTEPYTVRDLARAAVATEEDMSMGDNLDEDLIGENLEEFEYLGMAPDDAVSIFTCLNSNVSEPPSGVSADSYLAVEAGDGDEYVKVDNIWTRQCSSIDSGELLHAAQKNPRTALLLFEDDVFEVVVVDGSRNTDECAAGHECEGMTLPELARFAVNRGAKTAINLDGGTSSNFAWSDGRNIRCSSRTFSYPVAQIFAVVALAPEEKESYFSNRGSVPFSEEAYYGPTLPVDH